MALVSPGVQVTITDESFFIPNSAVTVPLLFISTGDEKTQPLVNGLTVPLPAAGTFEWDVVRTVTSRTQALELYGIPNFLQDNAGNQHHGDARNEYGLLALHQFLGVADRAYVVRTNVNLDDDLTNIRALWGSKTATAEVLLENLVTEFINEFNTTNGYIPGQTSLGFQDVNYGGTLVGTALAGLAANTYEFNINIDGVGSVNVLVPLVGTEDVDAVILAINTALPAGASATLTNGNIRFTSASGGPLSTIILSAGVTTDLFGAITGFVGPDTAVPGEDLFKVTVTGPELISLTNEATAAIWQSFSFSTLQPDFFTDITATPLDVFANGFDQPPPGTFIGFEGQVNDWILANSFGSIDGLKDEFTATDASGLFLAVADDFQYLQVFANETSLGANDAARRVAITTALQASINSNTEVRSENFEYNLVLCPGYHEVDDELVALSVDVQEEVFVIGETPMDMDPTQVVAWAGTVARQTSPHIAYYYPHSLLSNIDGVNVLGAASGTALRTYAFSDENSELWFAPAGTRRGLVSGVSDIGYASGQLGGATTFVSTHVNQGQRDDLYKYFTNINPIAFFPGRGILVWGQKTSNPDASALDRVNVSRLMKHIARQLRKNTLPFVFEPNDQLTRDNLKATVDNFLGDLIIKRGLFDFATVSDESNNTPDRIDRNELYIDIAVKPVRAAEFIFLPIRILRTDAEIGG